MAQREARQKSLNAGQQRAREELEEEKKNRKTDKEETSDGIRELNYEKERRDWGIS